MLLKRAPGSAGGIVLIASVALAILWLLSPSGARAQLSPGELSRAHAALEGSGSCLKCHQAKKRVDPALCLSCHQPLSSRIESGQGLHARPGYERCETCHIEHHGPDFELIWWGEEGRESFDHAQTGFQLEGAHVENACDDCHRRESMVAPEELERAGKALDRTYLGLDPQCLSCHEDEHRGQVAADSCASCHDFSAWVPASTFDHARTRFPLTGRHENAACTGCHATLEVPAGAQPGAHLQFAVEAFEQCGDCHRDPHEGRLGPTCASCHSTGGWSRFNQRVFDHGQTRFGLEGAHERVACESCHLPGAGFRVERFERCTDCHEDDHLGQFASYVEPEGCPACHTVDGFVPATFTLTDHQQTRYPLEGAHLAIPCLDCHREVTVEELGLHFSPTEGRSWSRGETARQFRFSGTECEECHGDPHRGELDRWREISGCETCHDLSSWRSVSFRHDLTELPLRGKHTELGCEACHLPEPESLETEPMPLTAASADCSSCHEDPHLAQFAAADRAVACETCHREEGWTDLVFDHDRDARFRLEGAHLKLQCASCHPIEIHGEVAVIRYRSLGTTCEACHATLE